jgi:ABC-type polysaccharide/polyol phosphate transport system ATPase subunit
MTWAVRFEEVSKRYRVSETGYPSLRYDLAQAGRRAAALLRRRAARPDGRLVLDRVSFEVGSGEAFALVGGGWGR